MRVTAVMAGVVSCALIFGINDAKANAMTPLELAMNESPSLIEDLSNSSATEEEANKDSSEAEKKEEKPKRIKHTVAEGESLTKIAKKYDTQWRRIFDKNTEIENPDMINVGEIVVIPFADEDLEQRELPEPVVEAVDASARSLDAPAPRQSQTAQTATSRTQTTTTTSTGRTAATPAPRGSTSGNLYAYGYCTWYVKNMRPDLPNNLGNADTWLSRARAQGYATGSSPRVGAVAYALTGYMHVAYVTAVHGNGTVTVSEMNFKGYGVTSTRTVPASQFAYIY